MYIYHCVTFLRIEIIGKGRFTFAYSKMRRKELIALVLIKFELYDKIRGEEVMIFLKYQ